MRCHLREWDKALRLAETLAPAQVGEGGDAAEKICRWGAMCDTQHQVEVVWGGVEADLAGVTGVSPYMTDMVAR
jgi:hypothetical protein